MTRSATLPVPAVSPVSQGADRAFRVCIVAHNAFGALANQGRGHIGGVEHQTTLLAKWLAAHAVNVALVTWDDPADTRAEIDGVKVIRICRADAGLPGLRFFHPRWTSLVRALRAADADVYYHNGAEAVTGQIANWCHRNGRSFVFSAAADADVDARLPAFKRAMDRRLYRQGLQLADRVVVQNEKQRRLLHTGFKREAVVLPMPCPQLPNHPVIERSAPNAVPRVLWVGRISSVKRLEWLLDLAERLPDVQFDVVGPAEHSDYASPLIARAKPMTNVTMHGRKNRAELAEYYLRADCLCCTSLREGFPNTFLEAWSHGLPVVSTLDIDDRIERLRLGAIGTTVDALAAAIAALLADPSRWTAASRAARRYFAEQHAVDIAMPRFADLLQRSLKPASLR